MATNNNRHRQKCGFNTHYLDDDHVLLTNPKLINFLKLANREFRASWPVCRKCANSLKLGYSLKLRRARQHYRRRQLPDVSSATDSPSTSSNHSGTVVATPMTSSSPSATPSAGAAPAFIEETLRKAAAEKERARRDFERMQREVFKNYQIIGG